MCDETLVTRIAEMANYFLDLLVGKKRKTLKVLLVNTLYYYIIPYIIILYRGPNFLYYIGDYILYKGLYII